MEYGFGLVLLALLASALALVLSVAYASLRCKLRKILVSRHKRLRERLRVSEVRLQQIINSVPALIAYVDAGQRYVYVNQLYQQRFAPHRSNILGCTVEDVLGHELYATASPMINLVLQGQAQSYEVQPFPDVWHLIHYFPTLDEQGGVTGYYVLGTDITALKAHEAELDRVANYDPLTGLPNRRLLFDRLRQALLRADRSGKLCAICFLDLDGFKAVNDRLGHGMGDQLLTGVAHNLAEALRAEDTLARLGGDEFVVLLSELDSIDECLLILDRMLEAARQPICIGEHTLQTSASMGVSLYPSDNPDPELLLRQADMAMYRAKQSGKDGYRLYQVDTVADVMVAV